MQTFFDNFTGYASVYTAVTTLFCIASILTSLEFLAIRNEFKDSGVFSWKVFSCRHAWLNSGMSGSGINKVFGFSGSVIINVVRMGCCILLPLPFMADPLLKALLLGVVAVLSLLFLFRNTVGNDGADQMGMIVCVTLLIAYLANDPFIYKAGLVFMASQSILAYVISGVAKACSAKWRNGIAVFQIMNTRGYGNPRIAASLSKAPRWVNLLACWSIILPESFFFLSVLQPQPYLPIFLTWGLLFHVYNAVVMGLNNFFWAFITTYPAIIYLSWLIAGSAA